MIFKDEKSLQFILDQGIDNDHHQPYFFALIPKKSEWILFEVQEYARKMAHLATWNPEASKMEALDSDILDRRMDLNGVPVKFALSTVEKDSPIILDILQEKLNFTFEKVDFEGYGTLLSNGSWLGAIRQIIHNEIDVAPIKLDLTKKRVEIVKPGYIAGLTVNYLIFNRKFQGSSLPWYTILQVFDKAVYLLLIAIIIILSLFLALMSNRGGLGFSNTRVPNPTFKTRTSQV